MISPRILVTSERFTSNSTVPRWSAEPRCVDSVSTPSSIAESTGSSRVQVKLASTPRAHDLASSTSGSKKSATW